ncbi:MAG: phosphatidylglycerol lysyltransferase domain-containing protein, partial [Candidatus Omnitrophota bacterium]
TGVVLGIDLQCPYLREIEREYLLNFALKLKEILEETSTLEMIYQNPGIIMSPHPNFQPLILWDKLNKIIFGKNLGLKIISLEDREIFKQFFMKKNITFSYAFEYLYAWKDIAYLLWKIIDKELLVFWKQKDDFFLLLSPGDALSLPVLSFIKNFLGKEIIIKNIGEEYLNFFKKNNWELKSEGQEYIYECEKIATLEGKDLKSRRWQSNYFYKHCLPRVRELKNEDIAECLELYVNWAEEKRRKNRPPYYFMLIEDNFFAQRRLLIDYVKLNLAGIVIEVEGKIVGYSFGYPLNEEEFCIFSEITNLKFKGITPYIFQEFCRKLKNYKFINAMDDAGLENLRRIKCAYAPLRIRRLYSAKYIQGEGFC